MHVIPLKHSLQFEKFPLLLGHEQIVMGTVVKLPVKDYHQDY